MPQAPPVRYCSIRTAIAPTDRPFPDNASSYELDVSTSRSFDSFVNNYRGRNVGNVTTWIVFGLNPGTTYYYRAKASGSFGTSRYSETKSVTTPTAAGLTINPTFDASITGNPNAAQIQGMINQAVAVYQALYSDQVTVAILFRYANTDPISGDPIDAIGQSYTWGYQMPWNNFISVLVADAKTTNDATANGTLPGNPLSTDMRVGSALGRAVALNTTGGLMIGNQGPFDGCITLEFRAAPSVYPASQPTELRRVANVRTRDRRSARSRIVPESGRTKRPTSGSLRLVVGRRKKSHLEWKPLFFD